ncbi:hypothetical protein CDQ91_07675 [Sphingopyxis witflariensis]|uniref:Uncharacterized protein n=1 Tax=Sphingopyxis witflariensis TaxID=173675 RepID=A0A246JYU5_9SPHN|nr:hypothetical protein CDQ91_07675 [Sphingopyxis witflariensis]
MEAWNEAYRREAEEIAASLLEADGFPWGAEQVRAGKRSQSRDVRIAMLALMVARGEVRIKRR